MFWTYLAILLIGAAWKIFIWRKYRLAPDLWISGFSAGMAVMFIIAKLSGKAL